MKLSLRIIMDSWNSDPIDECVFAISEDLVSIKTTGYDHNDEESREIAVDRAELMALLRVLEE